MSRSRRPSGCVRLGTALREVRKARGLRQTQLAAKAGVSQSRIAQWEGAFRAIRRCDLDRVADALDVTFEGVWTGSNSFHHGRCFCTADLGGNLKITCRSTGNTLYPPAAP